MSRSNTHYYNLCLPWRWLTGPGEKKGEIDKDGYCDFHRPKGNWHPRRKCIAPGEFETRRGIVVRGPRFPYWISKSWHSTPPRDIKRAWQGEIRAKHRAEIARHPDDPELFDSDKWLAGMYSWWG